MSFWQALIAGALGIAASFLLCGVIALAGKRGSAPTMVLSRAAFGVRGNRVPAGLSWLLTVGWETALTILDTLATATVFDELGWSSGAVTKIVALVVVALLIIAGGFAGFGVIMRMQTVITVITAVLTVVYLVVVSGDIDWGKVQALPSGDWQAVVGSFVLFMTGFGISWSTQRRTIPATCRDVPPAPASSAAASRIWDLVAPFTDQTTLDCETFGKWDTRLAERVDGDLVVTGVATGCCVISTVLAAADAGVRVRVVADACAGSSDDAHQQALDVMSRYAPLVELTTTAAELARNGAGR